MLTPIETVYRGCRFRSRLEARWAVFFDAAGIRWEYEPEGFALSSRAYLPDFWLPRSKAFLEIKPRLDGLLWAEQIAEIKPALMELADKSGHEVFLVVGSPALKEHTDDGMNFDEWPSIVGFAPGKGICSAELRQCQYCGNVAFVRLIGSMRCECRKGEFKDDLYSPYEWPPRILAANKKARAARFEYGECG